MTPSEAQRRALDALERLGGKPIVIREDAGLPNHSRLHIASSAEPAHVLTFRPASAAELPYLVCFQCGLAERALNAAPDERFNVAGTPDTYSRVEKLVSAKGAVPKGMVAAYSRMIADGLGTQLRSMPVGIRVDKILHGICPELRGMQRAIAECQLKECLGCLSPAIKETAPAPIYKASVGMNAAFALAWSRLWGEQAHVVPYRLAGHVALGEKLLVALDDIPDTPHHDRHLISSWAEILGIDDLYEIGPIGL